MKDLRLQSNLTMKNFSKKIAHQNDQTHVISISQQDLDYNFKKQADKFNLIQGQMESIIQTTKQLDQTKVTKIVLNQELESIKKDIRSITNQTIEMSQSHYDARYAKSSMVQVIKT